MEKYGKQSALVRIASCVALGGVGLALLASPVDAGLPPGDIDVDGLVLDFYSHPAPLSIGDLTLGDLPFVYNNVLDLPDSPCLQARISKVSKTDNMDVFAVDAESYDAGYFDTYLGVWVPNLLRESNPEIDLETMTPDGDGATATFQIEFLYDNDCDPTTGTSVPVTLTNLCVNIRDIDWQQFAGFSSPTSYTVSANTVLKISTSEGFLLGSETDGNGSDNSDEENWLQVLYDSASSIQFKVGINSGEEDDASFSVSFACADWSGETQTSAPPSGSGTYNLSPDHYLWDIDATTGPLPSTR